MTDKRHQTPDSPRRENVSESGHVSLPQPNAPEHFSGRIGSIFFIPEGAYLRIGVISGHASASASVLSVANGAMRQIKRAPLRQHVAAAGDAAPVPEAWNPPLRPACGRRKNRNLPQQTSLGHPPVFGPFRSCPGTAPRSGRHQARFPVRGGGRNPHLLGIRQRTIIHIVKQTGNGISFIVVPCQEPERSQENKGCYRRDASSHARPPFP